MARTTFWRSDVEKVYAFVARSTFGSQKFNSWGFSTFFDVQMSKKSLNNWTNPTNLTNSTKLANLTNSTNTINLTNLANKLTE